MSRRSFMLCTAAALTAAACIGSTALAAGPIDDLRKQEQVWLAFDEGPYAPCHPAKLPCLTHAQRLAMERDASRLPPEPPRAGRRD